jgi:hypothetical protein
MTHTRAAPGLRELGAEIDKAVQGELASDATSRAEAQAAAILEAASENRRGRPRLPVHPMLKGVFPDVTTERGLQNKHFAGVALQALGYQAAHERYPWFVGIDRRNFRSGVLVELGRLASEFGAGCAVFVADELLKTFPAGRDANTRRIADIIRNHRFKIRLAMQEHIRASKGGAP